MLKFICFALLYCSFSLGLTNAGQESFTILKLHDPETPTVFPSISGSGVPVAVSVSHEELKEISSSVLIAESWLRTHVLTHYPATKISTIVVSNNILCNNDHEKIWGLVLPSMKNIYHSLVRWGLEKQIKVSAGVSKACLHPLFYSYKDDISDSLIKPVLDFLYYSNSTYSVNPTSDFSTLSEKTTKLVVESHRVSMKKLGFLNAIDMNVVIHGPEEKKPIKRKLSSLSSSEVVDPFPARPTPTPMPIHSSIGYSVPAYVTKNPPSPSMYPPSPVVTPALPLVAPQPTQSMAPSPVSYSYPPPSPPVSYSYPPPSPPVSYSYPPLVSSPPLPLVIPGPANPPSDSFTYPPCVHSPPADAAPTPTISSTSPPPPGSSSVEKRLWCVAKPSVPADDLQEAIDYACGVGGADCDEIKPNGSCYNPDTVVAHASYAFNSYWQKNKNNGGTCSFGGTAMIISTDPSFLQCRFLLMD
ncbi:hypothetical protein MKX01_019399 [Papaver californicum]|nr:hypothetical protein MKX01_019399 [Papaver californicum]